MVVISCSIMLAHVAVVVIAPSRWPVTMFDLAFPLRSYNSPEIFFVCIASKLGILAQRTCTGRAVAMLVINIATRAAVSRHSIVDCSFSGVLHADCEVVYIINSRIKQHLLVDFILARELSLERKCQSLR